MTELSKIPAFLSGHQDREPSDLKMHLLNGWKTSTLLSYNAAIKKFLKYMKTLSQDEFLLPASPNDIYGFCMWAGRTEFEATGEKVQSTTLKNYILVRDTGMASPTRQTVSSRRVR